MRGTGSGLVSLPRTFPIGSEQILRKIHLNLHKWLKKNVSAIPVNQNESEFLLSRLEVPIMIISEDLLCKSLNECFFI